VHIRMFVCVCSSLPSCINKDLVLTTEAAHPAMGTR